MKLYLPLIACLTVSSALSVPPTALPAELFPRVNPNNEPPVTNTTIEVLRVALDGACTGNPRAVRDAWAKQIDEAQAG